jgi:O-antigen/teichoic acid export membrane protein
MIRDRVKEIFKSRMAISILTIVSGTGLSQILSILFSPIITRIYPPEQYGILTVYGAVLGMVTAISSMDYQRAIALPKEEEDAINVLVLAMSILVAFTIASVVILNQWAVEILTILDSTSLIKYKYLISVGIFFTGLYNILLQWAIRSRNYKQISGTKISQSFSSNITKIVLGLLRFGPFGLIIGNIIGQSAGISRLSLTILKKKKMFKQVRIDKIRSMAIRYIRFPLYSAPSNYIYSIGSQLPVIFLTSSFGSSVVGAFGLALTIVRIPMGLIGNSIAQVFYAEAAKLGKDNPKNIKKLTLVMTKKLALYTIVPLVLFIQLAPFLFTLIFGELWYEAGVYARLISIMIYFNFITAPIGRIPEIFNKQNYMLVLNTIRILTIIILFYVSNILNFTSYQVVGIYSAANSAIYFLLIVLVKKILDQESDN